jgi:hypothetical protein
MQCFDVRAIDQVTFAAVIYENKVTGVSLKMFRYVIDDTNIPAVHTVDIKLW